MLGTKQTTQRDSYFIGYADAYRRRIAVIDAENRTYRDTLDKWPDANYAPELRRRIINNETERRELTRKIARIMANARGI